jgi:hypothetical protein
LVTAVATVFYRSQEEHPCDFMLMLYVPAFPGWHIQALSPVLRHVHVFILPIAKAVTRFTDHPLRA